MGPGEGSGTYQQQQAPPSMADHLARLDLKLDCLSRQVEACLVGIHGLAGIGGTAMPGDGPSMGPRMSLGSPPPAKKPPEGLQPLYEAQEVPEGPHLIYEAQEVPEGPHLIQHEASNLKGPALTSTIDSGKLQRTLTSQSCMVSQRSSNSDSRHPKSRVIDFRMSLYVTVTAEDESIQQRWRTLGPVQLNLWRLMSNPESSLAAGLYNRLNPAFILLVVIFNMIHSLSLQLVDPKTSMRIEICIEAFFLLQISTQFAVCPCRRYFFLNGYNIIDVLSAVPLALRVYGIAAGGDQDIYTVILAGLVPVVRLLKTMRHFQTSRLLVNAFILAKEAVPVLLFYYAVVWLFFAGVLYAVEERSNLPSPQDAMWLTVVTMTTIGYGDVVPRTGAGRVVTTALVLVSSLYMAIPLGIIGSCFSAVWEDRDKILLFERLRTRLMEAGCSRLDMSDLFSRFSRGDGQTMDAMEFIDMCTTLKLGLSNERLMVLFNFWANEEDGKIYPATFQNILYPKDCLRELARQRAGQSNATAGRKTYS